MYFKSIELNGFKSFADRTYLPFEPGITAIIGPNGSGKSNILDALRWVLGEQSPKSLRGSHMQDVIFNGSEHRAATGMSEVTVVFDNADSRLPVDFAEVQVTRRLYRSGESEYLLNKMPCRLRDIQELFMDTGIGTNAYSLIGQGKIDLVLSSKPEDRRFLFEEAAGIIKYKTRKRTAMRKLENADQNLLRLRDVITEVERQTRSLKRQVAAAMRHRKLTEELRELEVRSAWLKFRQLTAEAGQLKKQYAKTQDAYETLSTELSGLEAREEQLSLERIEVERVLTARREGVHQIDTDMERIESDIALLRKEIEFSKQQQEQARTEHDEYQERAARILETCRETEERAATLRSEIADGNATLTAKQEEFDALSRQLAEAELRVEETRARAAEAVHSRSRTQTELETIEEGLQRVDTLLAGIYQRQEQQNGRIQAVTNDHAARVERARQGKERAAALQKERQEVAQAHGKAAGALEKAASSLQNLREQKSSLEARLRSLRELRDSYEGYATGVRAVMQARQEGVPACQGILGPVGELLVTEREYETAIEAALGGNINNVVVENADAAKDAISFLKENRAGRVTFLPLDTIRGSKHDDTAEIAGLPGIVGPAIQYVQFDPRIRPAVEYLLWNTVIVETIDDAIRIARSERRFPRLVTLEGEVVSSAGAVTGGRTKHESRGLLGRGAEIDELETQVGELGGNLEKTSAQARNLGEKLQELARRRDTLQTEEDATRRDLSEAEVAIARLSTELENLTLAAAQLARERDAACLEREELEQRRKEAQERASGIENDDEALQRRMAEAQEGAAQARQALSVCSDALADLRVRLAGLTQNLEEAERNRQREMRDHEEALREAARRIDLTAELQAREKDLVEAIASKAEMARALSESREQAEAKAIESQNRQQHIVEAASELGQKLKELREQTSTRMKEVHALDKDLTHHEDQITFFHERIQTEYHVALPALSEAEVGADEMDEETRENTIQHHRDALQRLGAVNLTAIEEYEALDQRLKFLISQEEDLRKARETLSGVIERIDRTIIAMFKDTFETVGENFKNYFRRLFNGGQARIYLLNEDDPLESGIEIEARPPGKKPQTISLLSGGEQALTAIALLFSIFSAKPSPFCVLDEVDAPLDDANIWRFLSLVDEFTNQSQFVVITHSKQTMSHADALFGVTQQERGVSQVVSVRFEEVADAEAPV
ncbi:MAG: chromosome segregation protein SMC [Candidatus Hydrogenedentes bacterium]|nr:chromosome segregation protein SMC [Candidatus Hydrogenedentota bacterium]